MRVRPIRNKILVTDMEKGERKTSGGIILADDDGKAGGIRPRWARVYAVSAEIKDPDLVPGKWVLVEHGRWTRAMYLDDGGEDIVLWGVEYPAPIMMIADECPVEYAGRFI